MITGRVVPIDPQTDSRWDAYLGRHPGARFPHTAGWLEVLRRTYGYTPAHLAYEVDGALAGVLPLFLIRSPFTGRRLVSLPFSGPAGPIGSTPEAAPRLTAAAMRLVTALRCQYLNIQSAAGPSAAPPPGFTTLQPFVSSLVSLQDGQDATWRRIRVQTVRQEIRQARRRGVVVEMAEGRRFLEAFYPLYVQTSRKHGIPPQPARLFDLMWAVFGAGGSMQLFLALREGRVINAMVCFGFAGVLSAAYVGTDDRALAYHPVRLTDWVAIEWACARGYRVFDFLQSHVRNTGLRWYKQSFGAIEQPVSYAYYPKIGTTARLREALIGRRGGAAGAARSLVRRLPAGALRLLGRAVFKHVG